MEKMRKFSIVMIFDEQNRVLFGKRKDNNLFTTVAGGVEENETPFMAGIREAKEEVNISIKPTELIYINEKTVTAKDTGKKIKIYLYKTKVNSKRVNLSNKNDPDDEIINNSLKFYKIPLRASILENLHVDRKDNLVVDYLNKNFDLDSISSNAVFSDKLDTLKDLLKTDIQNIEPPYVVYRVTSSGGEYDSDAEWKEQYDGFDNLEDAESVYEEVKTKAENSKNEEEISIISETSEWIEDDEDYDYDYDNTKTIYLKTETIGQPEYKEETKIRDWMKSRGILPSYEYESNSSSYIGFDLVDALGKDISDIEDEDIDNFDEIQELNRVVIRISDHNSTDGNKPSSAQEVTDYIFVGEGFEDELINELELRIEKIKGILKIKLDSIYTKEELMKVELKPKEKADALGYEVDKSPCANCGGTIYKDGKEIYSADTCDDMKDFIIKKYDEEFSEMDSVSSLSFIGRLKQLAKLIKAPHIVDTKIEDKKKADSELISKIQKHSILKNTVNDITYDMGYNAHRGTSFSPEIRAVQVMNDYLQTILDSYEGLVGIATTEEHKEIIDDNFIDFLKGYKTRYIKMLTAKSRIVSTMISGGGNFPVARMNKLNGYERNASDDLYSYSDYKINKIKAKIYGTEIIKSNDDDAIEKLNEKLKKLENNHEQMKKANKILKSKSFDNDIKIEKLKEIGFSEANAKELLVPDYGGRVGFASFSLTNNNAKIKSTKNRISELEKAKEIQDSGGSEDKEYDGLTVHENFEEMRVQLIFDEKPTAEDRAILKKRGFRWSGKHGAWQRHLNSNGRYAVESVIRDLGLDEIV